VCIGLAVVLPLVFQDDLVLAGLLVEVLLALVEPHHVLFVEVLAVDVELLEVFTQHFAGVVTAPVFLDYVGHLVQNFHLLFFRFFGVRDFGRFFGVLVFLDLLFESFGFL